MQDDRFEWDDDTARANLVKHKVAFSDASRIFDSHGYFEEPDLTEDYGEERFRAVGLVNGIMFTIFYTIRGRRTRIISARRANTKEARAYAERTIPI